MRAAKVLSVLCVALAVYAVALGMDTPPPSGNADFAQGAYEVLLEAEEALRDGEVPEARRAFYAATLRAMKYGKEGIGNRVRNRMASAGMELCRTGNGSGWELLAYYALWSDAFGEFSGRVEGWYLGEVGPRDRFPYPLVGEDGRTAWGDAGRPVPIWLFFRVPRLLNERERLRGLAGPLYFTKLEEIPRGFREAVVFFLHPSRPDSASPESVCVTSRGERRAKWYLSWDDRVRWDAPMVPSPDPTACLSLPAKRYSELDRLVLLTNGEAPRFSATLEHRYEALAWGATAGAQATTTIGGVTE